MPGTNSLFLLVEDNSGDILLVRRAFKKANILNPLQVVRSGEEAIQYLLGEGLTLAAMNSHCLQLSSST